MRKHVLIVFCIVVVLIGWRTCSNGESGGKANNEGPLPKVRIPTESAVPQPTPGTARVPSAQNIPSANPLDDSQSPQQIAAEKAANLAQNGSSGMSYEHRGVIALIQGAARECYELAAIRTPTLSGHFVATLQLATDRDLGSLIGDIEMDEESTSVSDPQLVECIKENVLMGEEILETANEKGKVAHWGDVQIVLDVTFPLTGAKESDWPEDDDVPACPAETSANQSDNPLAHWCEDSEGRKQGDEYLFSSEGELMYILLYIDGSSKSMRVRPVDGD